MRLLLAVLLFFAGFAEAREISDLRTYGDPAPMDIYLFTSVDCPHCRKFHKTIFSELLKRFVNTHKAQLFIVDMPTKEPAIQGTMLMRCLPPEKAHKLMGWLYENQGRWKREDFRSIFLQYAQALNMTISDFNDCLNNQKLREDIVDQYEQLRILYQVRATPTTVLRHGNVIKHYVGTDRRAVINGMEKDISDYEKTLSEKAKAQ